MAQQAIEAAADKLATLLASKQLAVFCGAGISFDSGLPVVSQIMGHFLDELRATPEEREVIEHSGMPFELFLQTLHEQEPIDDVMDIFAAGKPNTNHLLIAQLMRLRLATDVCTTNFDSLLEQALSDMGMIPGRDYALVAHDDEFKEVDWSSPLPRLLKIHGTVTDKSSMAFTLRQVAAQKLTESRSAIVDRLFRNGPHTAILILGYSCSDLFDISPRIESYQEGTKEVFLVEHGDGPIHEEEVRLRKTKNPFKRCQGVRMFANTKEIVGSLWLKTLPVAFSEVSFPPSDAWRMPISRWARRGPKSEEGRKTVLAALMFAAGRPKLGLPRIASISWEKNGATPEAVAALINKGAGLGASGYYDQAAEVLCEALTAVVSAGLIPLTGLVVSDLAMARLSQGRVEEAYELATYAAGFFKLNPDKRSIACNYDTIATCCLRLGRFDDAFRIGTEALNMFKELGDVRYTATVQGNLSICLEHQGKKREAFLGHEKAYSLSASIADAASMQLHLSNLWRLANELHDETLIAKYRDAAAGLDSGEDEHNSAVFTANSANDLALAHKYEEALPLYDKAIATLRNCGDLFGVSLHLYNRGRSHLSLHRLNDAFKDFTESMEIAADRGDAKRVIESLIMIGKVLAEGGELVKSLESLKSALELMRSSHYTGAFSEEEVARFVEKMSNDPRLPKQG